MSSPYGPLSSRRYKSRDVIATKLTSPAQALEGKDVKDMLLNVGSGGGAAAAAPAAGGAGGAAGEAPAEEKKEEKEEGTSQKSLIFHSLMTISLQRRKSRTRTWASVSSTRQAIPFHFFCTHIAATFTASALRWMHGALSSTG